MTKQEEILTLRKFPRHYLWNKPRNQWTPEDIENLKNGVIKRSIEQIRLECAPRTKNISRNSHRKQPVVLVVENKQQCFESVKELSQELDMPYSSLTNILNGHSPQRKEFQIFKSKICQ